MRLKIQQKIADLIVSPKSVTTLDLAPFDVAAGAIQKSIVDAKGDLIAATAADTVVRLPVGTNAQILTADSTQTAGVKWADAAGGGRKVIWFQANGGGVAPAVGKIGHFRVPADRSYTLKKVTLLADASGSIVVDLRKETYANYSSSQPDSADSICSTSKPTLSSAVKTEDSTLSGWTTTLSAGDVLQAYVESASTLTLCDILIEIE